MSAARGAAAVRGLFTAVAFAVAGYWGVRPLLWTLAVAGAAVVTQLRWANRPADAPHDRPAQPARPRRPCGGGPPGATRRCHWVACGFVHNSWALVRVATVILNDPGVRHSQFDLAPKAGVSNRIVTNLLSRMVGEGWMVTEDGWAFELTPKGRRALVKTLQQARAFGPRPQHAPA